MGVVEAAIAVVRERAGGAHDPHLASSGQRCCDSPW
jgi:hypothetical protein